MKMDIGRLKEGMTVKSYRDLCRVLGIKVVAGNAKKAQIKEFERFVKFRNDGYKFIIEEIYKFPKPKEDGRFTSGNQSIYTLQCQQLILDLLSRQENKRIDLVSITGLIKSIHLVNSQYNRQDTAIRDLSDDTNIDKKVINDFYNETQATLKKHIETALKILDKKEILRYEIGMAVVETSDEDKDSEVVIDGITCTYVGKEIHRRATREERELILDVEKQVLATFGAYSRQQIFMTGAWEAFRKNTNKIVSEYTNIKYYYECYDIVYNEKAVIEELEKMELDNIRLELNDKIINQLTQSTKTKCKRARTKSEKEDAFISPSDKLKCLENYEEDSEILRNKTIKITK